MIKSKSIHHSFRSTEGRVAFYIEILIFVNRNIVGHVFEVSFNQ